MGDDYDDYPPLKGDEEEAPLSLQTSFPTVIVVDNIPVVPLEKFEKLHTVVRKIFSQIGTIAEDGLEIPHNDQGTKGYAFVEFTTHESAENAVQQTNGYKLDKQHIFKVTRLEDYLKLKHVQEEYKPPEVKPYEPKEDLYSWLLDERSLKCIDQYVIRQGDLTDIYWNDVKGGKPQLETSRPKWTETYVMWSPLGTYLSTFHKQGVVLWGGASWSRLARFNHPGVKLADFSPNEGYLISVSPQFQEDDDPKNPKCIAIWDAKTGARVRGFLGDPPKEGQALWPIFHWSFDDKYFARLNEDAISIYETPSMGLLDKTSLKIPGVKDFSWSPTQHLLAYFVPENGNSPAKVVVVEIPSRKEVRQKNWVNVSSVKMHWQSDGKYLAVKVDRKTKKTQSVSFELFRIRERDIPIELIEIKDPVIAFAWEPKGDRFAIIHGENALKPDISFYEVDSNKVRLLKTIEKKQSNSLFWSPKGQFIVLAGLKNFNGQLEFFDVDTMETLGNEEHAMCTGVEWDPTGRYVVTTVSHWRTQMETGYHMYTFSGRAITKVMRDRFFQLLWRPRPPTLLSKEKEAEIKKNLKNYSRAYDDEDEAEIRKIEEEKRRQREATKGEFYALLRDREAEYRSRHAERAKLRGGRESDDENDFYEIEEVVDDIIEETSEVVDDEE
eukprot:TRINITY_DN4848_c0_g1_i1.p1 TRINITY_DN4848_c0_g1~~TRINITY_DN4848_c0_g1_i1.p1  ORF type:complete len:666 (-),score=150.28 TRINITY_DN4848_c0_g1_i1:61-2058(-)